MTLQILRVVLLLLLCTGGCLNLSRSDIDPCLIFNTFNGDAWRDPATEAAPEHCDSRLDEGWYTFHLNNDFAYIPTTCMQEFACGTEVPMRVDLEGQNMPEVGQTINASLCGSARVLNTLDCCVLRRQIRIKLCHKPRAFIYHLQPIGHCHAAICALPIKVNETDRKYRFESGDVPLSLQTTTSTFIPTTESSSPIPEVTNASFSNASETTSQENTTVAVTSTESGVSSTSSTEKMTSVTASSSTGLPPHSTLQFVLMAHREDPQDLSYLLPSLKEAVRVSTQRQDTDSSTIFQVRIESSRSRVLIASVTFIANTTDGMAGYSVQDSVDFNAFQTSLPKNLSLLAVCTKGGPCHKMEPTGSPLSQRAASGTSFTSLLLIILIILVMLIALGLLAYGSVRLYKHCSKRGTWVPPPDQKGDAETGDTGKAAEAANGGEAASSQQPGEGADAGKSDEAGWWVVPLDQVPGNGDAPPQDSKTQDTHM